MTKKEVDLDSSCMVVGRKAECVGLGIGGWVDGVGGEAQEVLIVSMFSGK